MAEEYMKRRKMDFGFVQITKYLKIAALLSPNGALGKAAIDIF